MESNSIKPIELSKLNFLKIYLEFLPPTVAQSDLEALLKVALDSLVIRKELFLFMEVIFVSY